MSKYENLIENEADLYELYATHIEYSHNDRNMKRGTYE